LESFFAPQLIEHRTSLTPQRGSLISLSNFTLQHQIHGGDRVLKKVAALMREFFNKETDILARYGGEETQPLGKRLLRAHFKT
jgi:hypothetical protein